MSAATYLATWATLPRPTASPGPDHRRPEVPRQRTWQEGRWHRLFHPQAAELLPTQRRAHSDRMRPRPAAFA